MKWMIGWMKEKRVKEQGTKEREGRESKRKAFGGTNNGSSLFFSFFFANFQVSQALFSSERLGNFSIQERKNQKKVSPRSQHSNSTNGSDEGTCSILMFQKNLLPPPFFYFIHFDLIFIPLQVLIRAQLDSVRPKKARPPTAGAHPLPTLFFRYLCTCRGI